MPLNGEIPLTNPEVRLLDSLNSSNHILGFTHNFYRYPARMSPELVKELINNFSTAGDYILDPFMGGGTTVVEALAAGRQAIGIDINQLSVFVTSVKTTPLSINDKQIIQKWLSKVNFSNSNLNFELLKEQEPRIKNLPEEMTNSFFNVLENIDDLDFPRQKAFIRCALLKLGQWAVDCKSTIPDSRTLKDQLINFSQEMFEGLDEFVNTCQENAIPKNKITIKRDLLLRSAIGAEEEVFFQKLAKKPKLVITSPPYPGVHVLYHRWQVLGRKETPAPYWLINAQDGNGASYYTLGSRTPFGIETYFQNIVDAYKSIKKIIDHDSLIVQVIAFSDIGNQLSTYLAAMEKAGFEECMPDSTTRDNWWRTVPNRKWYSWRDSERGSTKELLLFHKPK